MPVIIHNLTFKAHYQYALNGKHLEDLPNNHIRHELAQHLAQGRLSVSIFE